jgi:hypothetical protein
MESARKVYAYDVIGGLCHRAGNVDYCASKVVEGRNAGMVGGLAGVGRYRRL